MPSSALVKEGDDVQLVCEADGNPAPVFSFLKREVGTWAPPPWQASRVLAAACALSAGPRAVGCSGSGGGCGRGAEGSAFSPLPAAGGVA